jgi:hypothetical protein
MNNYSNDYYRALARYVLDLWYRNSLDEVQNNPFELRKVIKDGGFVLDSREISSISNIINGKNIDEIIKIINGNEINIPNNHIGIRDIEKYLGLNIYTGDLFPPDFSPNIFSEDDYSKEATYWIPKKLISVWKEIQESIERQLHNLEKENLLDLKNSIIKITFKQEHVTMYSYKDVPPPTQVKPVDVVGE